MKKFALMALLPLLLIACREEDAADATAPAEVEVVATETPAVEPLEDAEAEEPVVAAEPEENVEPEEVAAEVAPAEVPAGYTRVADLSEEPVRTFEAEPEFALEEGKDYAAVLETSKGQIVIDLHEDVPTTVNSFVWLARHHFYDDILFHRVIDGFVVQGGDPNTLKEDRGQWGTGGPGYSIPLEVRQKYTFDEKGVLGMARSQDPDSGGSQFYLTLAPTPSLNGQYTVFGKVVKGLDVLDQIKKYEAPAEGEPDAIKDIYIVTKDQ